MMAAGAHEDADDPPRRPALKKSAPAQPWSHTETLHLISAYGERWTALGRGQLKAQQWEQVAADVAALCAASGVAVQRKTGTQCRHKLEKLRKRYRTEGARPVTSLWPFFRAMDQLERGPLAATSGHPPAAGSPPAAASDEEEEEEEEEEEAENDEEEEEEELVPRNNNTRSINGIIREFGSGLAPRHPQLQLQQPPPPSITPSTAPPRKRVAYEAFQAKAAAAAAAAVAADKDKEDEEVELVRRPSGRGGTSSQVSAVLRDFSEGVMRLERRRMEMQWEIERGWQEMEARHTKMLQDAQRQLRDAMAAACKLPPKKARRDYGSNGDS